MFFITKSIFANFFGGWGQPRSYPGSWLPGIVPHPRFSILPPSRSSSAISGQTSTWGETFRFGVEDPASQTVDVVVVDRLTNQTLGEASIRLADLQPGQRNIAVPLFREDLHGEWVPVESRLHLELGPEGFGPGNCFYLQKEELCCFFLLSVFKKV